MASQADIRIGTAGWSIPRAEAERFPGGSSLLVRYAQVFKAAEINSSFHRPHRPATYARWAASVPADFRFAAKIPKQITHELKLAGAEEPLARFLAEVGHLGEKLGPLLVQLPPKLAFNESVSADFFERLRDQFEGPVVCEPRHASWFTPEVDKLLSELRIARAAADPAILPAAAEPAGWPGLIYFRLHGSPDVYWSSYSTQWLASLAEKLEGYRRADTPAWCIFDNTASGAATSNGLELQMLCEGAASTG